jgi:hypothetical protein
MAPPRPDAAPSHPPPAGSLQHSAAVILAVN